MAEQSNDQATVVRTERGLSVAGTRITLYAILDYLHADWPPGLIQNWLGLTADQMAGVLAYLDTHRDEVEREYQQVVAHADELHQYWDARLQQHLAERPAPTLTPEDVALRTHFQAWKATRT